MPLLGLVKSPLRSLRSKIALVQRTRFELINITKLKHLPINPALLRNVKMSLKMPQTQLLCPVWCGMVWYGVTGRGQFFVC